MIEASVLESLTSNRWKKLTVTEKVENLQKIENCLAKDLKRPVRKIEYIEMVGLDMESKVKSIASYSPENPESIYVTRLLDDGVKCAIYVIRQGMKVMISDAIMGNIDCVTTTFDVDAEYLQQELSKFLILREKFSEMKECTYNSEYEDLFAITNIEEQLCFLDAMFYLFSAVNGHTDMNIGAVLNISKDILAITSGYIISGIGLQKRLNCNTKKISDQIEVDISDPNLIPVADFKIESLINSEKRKNSHYIFSEVIRRITGREKLEFAYYDSSKSKSL